MYHSLIKTTLTNSVGVTYFFGKAGLAIINAE